MKNEIKMLTNDDLRAKEDINKSRSKLQIQFIKIYVCFSY